MGLSFDETRRDEDETLTIQNTGEYQSCLTFRWKYNFLGTRKREFAKVKIDGDLERRLKKNATEEKRSEHCEKSIQ